MSGSDPNDDVIETVEASRAAGRHQRRRVVFVDQQRPVSPLCTRQVEPIQYRRRQGAAMLAEIGFTLAAPNRSFAEVATCGKADRKPSRGIRATMRILTICTGSLSARWP